MSTQRISSMYRSGTMPFSLPKISKLNVKESRYNQTQRKSSFHMNISKARHSKSFMEPKQAFTARVQHQILDQNEYPYIETTNIEKEHSKLKDLLKQFNDQTVTILQKYVIDKPIRKEQVKKKQPVHQLYFARDKEAENAGNMIALLKNQIQKLQSKCENLKYMSKEEFQHRIRELKEDKQRIIVENKEVSREITLNGLEMVRGKDSLVKELEYDQFLIDSKRDRLKKDSDSVKTELASLQSKTKQLNLLIDKYEHEQSYTLRLFEQLQRQKSQNRLYEQLSKKKKILEHNKVMNQSTNYQLKHKYFQKLKQLDQYSVKDEEFNRKMAEYEGAIDRAKGVVREMEKKEGEVGIGGGKMREKVGGSSTYLTEGSSINAKINFSQTTSAKINVSLQ